MHPSEFVHSCVSEPYAWGKDYKGSVFIQTLCKMLKVKKNVELISLLTWINAEVSKEYEQARTNPDSDQNRSDYPIPEIHSQLRASYKWADESDQVESKSVTDGREPQTLFSKLKRPFTSKRTSKLL